MKKDIVLEIAMESFIEQIRGQLDKDLSSDLDKVIKDHGSQDLILEEDFNEYFLEFTEIGKRRLDSFKISLENVVKNKDLNYIKKFSSKEAKYNEKHLRFEAYYKYRKEHPKESFPECAVNFALDTQADKLLPLFESNQ